MRFVPFVLACGVAAAAPCPKPDPPQIHQDSVDIEPGGGVIVEMRSDVHETNVIRFRQAGVEIAPETVRAIAPGLDVYELPRTGLPDVEVLLRGRPFGKARRIGTTPLLDAPKVKRLVWKPENATQRKLSSEMEIYGNLGPETEVVTAYLDGTSPPSFGLVISRIDAAGKVTPAAWGSVAHLTDQVFVVTQSCRVPPPYLRAGDRVVVAWLDRSGRLGAQSKPIVIGR